MVKTIHRFFISSVLLVLVSSIAIAGGYQKDSQAHQISVMSYNTENSFDAIHDEGKDDYTFLPIDFPGKKQHCYANRIPYYREFCLKTDWTDDKVQVKIGQLTRMISHQGYIPDLVALQEVENENVVGMLSKSLGYEKFIITESPDRRGIDVALMFNQDKLAYQSYEELLVSSDELTIHTRNILRVNFHIKDSQGATLAVYVNHWPSQQNPKENRLLAADILKADIIKQRRQIGKEQFYAVALGDFNTTERESPNSVSDVMTARGWDSLVDVQEYSQEFKGKDSGLEGTYFYASKMKWERIDRILVSKNMLGGKGAIHALTETFKVLRPQFAMHDYTENRPKNPNNGKTARNVPIPYNFDSRDPDTAGYSDHLPVFVKLGTN